MPHYSISRLARQFGLSRSTLLYYDRIGLLTPSLRDGNNYRVYSEADRARMAKIDLYRTTGLPLDTIRQLLDQEPDQLQQLLEQRLDAIGQEMQALREQQQVIQQLLTLPRPPTPAMGVDKAQWVAMLRAAGLDEAGMARWHRTFERTAPEAHQAFMESLGIAAEAIGAIRAASRDPVGAD